MPTFTTTYADLYSALQPATFCPNIPLSTSFRHILPDFHGLSREKCRQCSGQEKVAAGLNPYWRA